MAVKRVKIDELIPDAGNANRGTQRGLRLLDDSLRELGAGRSIVLDAHNRIIAGNKTTERAEDLGLEDVIIIETDGHELVAVKRVDLDLDNGDGRARRLAYYDNRVGELDLDWDVEQLAADLDAGLDLSGLWSVDELLNLNIDLGGEADTPFAEFNADELEDYVSFRFGDYSGKVEQSIYDTFVTEYQRQQEITGEVMISDVLRTWLNV